jgi:hypothetical protein
MLGLQNVPETCPTVDGVGGGNVRASFATPSVLGAQDNPMYKPYMGEIQG